MANKHVFVAEQVYARILSCVCEVRLNHFQCHAADRDGLVFSEGLVAADSALCSTRLLLAL